MVEGLEQTGAPCVPKFGVGATDVGNGKQIECVEVFACGNTAAEGGAIGLVHEGDTIEIDIPNRSIHLVISDEELAARRAEMEARGSKAWKPENRDRYVSAALRAYGAMATSADKGAVRDVSQIER